MHLTHLTCVDAPSAQQAFKYLSTLPGLEPLYVAGATVVMVELNGPRLSLVTLLATAEGWADVEPTAAYYLPARAVT
jgi:hypothetical protein